MIYANEIDTSEETFENECNSTLKSSMLGFVSTVYSNFF